MYNKSRYREIHEYYKGVIMSEEIAQLTFDDIKTVVEKMKNFQPDTIVDK